MVLPLTEWRERVRWEEGRGSGRVAIMRGRRISWILEERFKDEIGKR